MEQAKTLELVQADRAEGIRKVLDDLECDVHAVSELAISMFEALDWPSTTPVQPDTAKQMLALLQSMLADALVRADAAEKRIDDAGASQEPAPAETA